MRVATLALLASLSRALVISRTAKFTVISARFSRAMGDFTTTPEERAEAAAMRKTAGASTVAPTVASCAIGQGIQKYVLVQAGDRYFVRGNTRAAYHKDAARPLVDELTAMGVAHEVLGGGRIQADLANKKIAIYGHSIGFPWQGEFRHDLTAAVVAEAPDAEVTTSNEGY
ncbi:hypothetical protein JL722_3557 [Aureococcus anophagefferens]|nr:hypothetical protein JL722_3557 [Aureococcus anophagefferens]